MALQSGKVQKKKNIGSRINKSTPFLMLLPAIISLLIVSIYPTLRTVLMSFFDKSLLKKEEPFVGLANYIEAFSKSSTWQTVFNTLFFAIVSLILGVALAMYIATKLIKPYPLRGFFRAMFLIPWVTPPLVASIVWRFIFSENFSPINSVLLKLNIIDTPVNFLGGTTTFLGISKPLVVLTIINVWSIFPFLMVMFIAGLQTVPQDIYEAAKIDGATPLQSFLHITLPLIRPYTFMVVILGTIWSFQMFDLAYTMTGGGPGQATMTLVYLVYNTAYRNCEMGYACSIAMLLFAIVVVISIIQRKLLGKSKED